MQKKTDIRASISIVVPVYNSEKSIRELIGGIDSALKDYVYEIILIDDFSGDASFETIKNLNHERIKAIRLKRNYGQQNAVKCGIDHASNDYIVTMDDDLQHQASDIIELVNKNHEYDVVYGIYDYHENYSVRKLGSKLVNQIFNRVLRKPDNIRISSFRSMNRKIADLISSDQTSFVYLSAMIISFTDSIANVKVKRRERKYGKSNYNYLKLIGIVIKLCVYYGDNFFLKLFRRNTEQYEIEEVWRKK